MGYLDPRGRPGWSGGVGRLVGVALLGLGACGSCVDLDEPCGHDQHLDEGGYCACDDGFVLGQGGCDACGAHEVVRSGRCECEAGFGRPAPDETCAELPEGAGVPCEAEEVPCTDAEFSVCRVPAQGGDGYCTKECATHEECPTGWGCDPTEPATCRRPPTGQGQECASDADCAGTEATYCESSFLGQCLVEGCQVDANDCSMGHTCCDLSAFGLENTLCLPTDECP